MDHFEAKLSTLDLKFALWAQEAALEYHAGKAGESFERNVRQTIADLLPGGYTCNEGLLAVQDAKDGKQLDVVVHPARVPKLMTHYPTDWVALAGEVKRNLRNKSEIVKTAARLQKAMAERVHQRTLPFAVLADRVNSDSPAAIVWITDLLGKVIASSSRIEPAIFAFSEASRMTALTVGEGRLFRARAEDGSSLDGVIVVRGAERSPSVLCYLWIWSAIQSFDPRASLEYAFMQDHLESLSSDYPMTAEYCAAGSTKSIECRLVLTLPAVDELAFRAVPMPSEPSGIAEQRPAVGGSGRGLENEPDASRAEDAPERVMLINLGPWGDQTEFWDESPWGGSAQEQRAGFGYWEGMSDQDLLQSARVFWKFNPESSTWAGVKTAVIVHAGVTRAVLSIDRFIGPFWGRHGFQGRVVHDPAITDRFVGRSVPPRQNPVTSMSM